MPEEDLETSELKEQIDQRLEEHEHTHGHGHDHGHGAGKPPGPGWLRILPLSTAMIAVFAAVASLKSGESSNEAILKKSEAMLNQSLASDQWAYYQAKSVKQKLSADEAKIVGVAGEAVKDVQARLAELKAGFEDEARRYGSETKEIEAKAHHYEAQKDEDNERSEALMERHHRFAFSVTLLQIAIALSAIAALTRRQLMWYLGLGVSVAGAAMFVLGWLTAA
ncbi:MAG TPA: DUF4337 domain-containing protein [Kofleriaceae bacterium]|nr:DUF4337 domain-containing protein [Kofleriaceae bacterium]